MRELWVKGVELIKFMLVFTVLTLFFYGVIVWIAEQIEIYHQEEEPRGRAVKVIDQTDLQHFDDVKNRLMFYYWFGE
jgi:hypothetical protein